MDAKFCPWPRVVGLGLFLLLSLGLGSARADQGVLRQSCMACHDLDKPVVGPAFKAVAQRYRNQTDAAALLARRIREGSTGQWGGGGGGGAAAAMPPAPQIKEVDARKLAAWVLEQ